MSIFFFSEYFRLLLSTIICRVRRPGRRYISNANESHDKDRLASVSRCGLAECISIAS